MSTRMSVVRAYVRWRYRARHDVERMRRELPDRQLPSPVPIDVSEFCDVDVTELPGGRVVRTLTPRSSRTHVQVLHLHGGAYVYPPQDAHWRALARLSHMSGATIHAPLYALAPSATVDNAHTFLDVVVDRVRAIAGEAPVYLSGDSAGGGLALSYALRMRERGFRPTDGILLFSPWLDLGLTNPEISRLERRDPMLSRRMLALAGRWWAGERDITDPLVSPVRGELSGLPPVTIYVGGRDMLVADARQLDRRIRIAGGESTLREWASGFHVFMGALTTKEARAVLTDAASLLRLAPSYDQPTTSGMD